MTVRVNKDSFNLREKLSELERPIGLKGSDLMGAETAQEARDLVSAGRKNLIINGGLQIWQRGTSITANYASRPYTADMFRIYNLNSGSGGTFSQSTDVPSNEFTYSFKRDTTGKNGHSEINIPIELNRTGSESPFVPGEIYTFSFWVKGDGTDTSWINIIRARWSSSLTSGTYITTKVIKEYSGSGNWEKVICQFTISPDVPSTATYLSILIGRNNSHIGINYWTGFQLEKGRNATEFEHRSYGEELALCQRYFYINGGEEHDIISQAFAPHTSEIAVAWPHPTEMRAVPSVTISSTNNDNTDFYFRTINNTGFALTGNGRLLAQMTKHHASIWFNGMSGVPQVSGQVRVQNNRTAFIHLSAEL